MIRLEPMRPGETRDYLHDWSPFLGDDTIASETTTGTGITIVAHTPQSGAQSVRFTLSAVSPGLARITHTITTAGGQTETEVFTLLVASAEEPVSVAELKQHIGLIDDDSRDQLLAAYISAARTWVEDYTGQVLVMRSIESTFSAFGDYLTIFQRPILSVDGVTYLDADGEEQEFEDFIFSSGTYPYRIYPVEQFPTLGDHGAITVAMTAGYAEGEAPMPLVQAILILAGFFFVNRSDAAEPPTAVKALCKEYRAPGMA